MCPFCGLHTHCAAESPADCARACCPVSRWCYGKPLILCSCLRCYAILCAHLRSVLIACHRLAVRSCKVQVHLAALSIAPARMEERALPSQAAVEALCTKEQASARQLMTTARCKVLHAALCVRAAQQIVRNCCHLPDTALQVGAPPADGVRNWIVSGPLTGPLPTHFAPRARAFHLSLAPMYTPLASHPVHRCRVACLGPRSRQVCCPSATSQSVRAGFPDKSHLSRIVIRSESRCQCACGRQGYRRRFKGQTRDRGCVV